MLLFCIFQIQAQGAIKNNMLKDVVMLEGTPIATDATQVTETSFIANWNSLLNAEGYFLDIYEIKTIDLEKNSLLSLLSENFQNFSLGSILEPDITNIGVGNINPSYTKVEGWFGNDIYQAGGNMYMPTYAKIFTPNINLSTGTKNFSIKITFSSATPDAEFLIAHTPDGNGRFWENEIEEEYFFSEDLNNDGLLDGFYGIGSIENKTYSFNFYKGDVNSSIYLEVLSGNVTINAIEIVQEQKVGDKTETYAGTFVIEGNSTTQQLVSGTEVGVGYAYTVRGFIGIPNQYSEVSNLSNKIYVTNTVDTKITKEKNPLIIFRTGDNIYINLAESEVIFIYNSVGKLIKTINAEKGINEIPLRQKGIYIIKTKNNIEKIIL